MLRHKVSKCWWKEVFWTQGCYKLSFAMSVKCSKVTSTCRNGFPDVSVGKESACKAGDIGDRSLIPGSGRSPGGVNGNPLQYYHLKKPMDRGAWRAIVHEVTKSQM